ncbi:MAG: hypothetical protein AAFR35_03760 [Pseudomonadota bacterium]
MTDFHSVPPCLPEPWALLDPEDRALLVRRLEEFGLAPLKNRRIGAVRVRPLEAYSGWMLVDLAVTEPLVPEVLRPDPDAEVSYGRGGVVSVLYGPGGATVLDGASAVIHEVNRSFGVDLSTDAAALDYLRYFCFFVHGDLGPFALLGSAADCVATKKVKGLKAKVKPPLLVGDPDPETRNRKAAATVLYGQSLFAAEFEIRPDGMIEMLDDTVLAEEVEAKIPLEFDGALRRVRPSSKSSGGAAE